MMSDAAETENHAGFAALIDIDMGIDVFGADWLYCDRISSYVARMVSHNRTDSLLYANLLSSALNELLETAFRRHGPSGRFSCRVLRKGARDRIELEIPCDSETAEFFKGAVARLSSEDVPEQYRAALFTDGPLDPRVGLLELTVDYDAQISVTPLGSDAVRLVAQITLEGDGADA